MSHFIVEKEKNNSKTCCYGIRAELKPKKGNVQLGTHSHEMKDFSHRN